MASWLFLEKMLSPKPAPQPAPLGDPDPEGTTRQLVDKGPLNQVGQQSEHVRERIGHLTLRLDELKTLADDFGQIVQPLNEFVVQHAQTKARLLETEALLTREREFLSAARTELNEMQATASRTSGDLAAALGELRAKEEVFREQEDRVTELRLRVNDQDTQLHNLEQQLASETEHARALTEDNQALRVELYTLESAHSRAESELAEAREQVNVSYAENTRLQQLAETLSSRLASLKANISELEPQVQIGRQEIADLHAKLSSERSLRQKIETNRELERSAQDGEISSLKMKIDGLSAHIGSTERMLSHTKDQLRDRSEALRSAEKAIKDAIAERVASERRAELAQEASSRLSGQIGDLQRSNSELKDRCEMLAKALSAKDALVDSGARKIANLEGHIDQLNARAAQEHALLEATNRRLIEELQSEKAERSLAQGALDIARNSRVKLLTQYTALKRQQPGGGSRSNEGSDEDLKEHVDVLDNVRAFRTPDRTE